ncbi:MAG: hypothetical protein DBW93_03855 [SAR86 cluster bacterium]|nr:MAG: hypothetical protein DBW93_03855 [SAR86 cluster bacterium]
MWVPVLVLVWVPVLVPVLVLVWVPVLVLVLVLVWVLVWVLVLVLVLVHLLHRRRKQQRIWQHLKYK